MQCNCKWFLRFKKDYGGCTMSKFSFIPMFDTSETEEMRWTALRYYRDILLKQSDWTQLPDSPVDKLAWATYRQALRDLPAQGGLADDAEFPTSP